ncbi:MAG: hypothetical protein U5L45_04225 [Saprospiraceae bacterium]|nr:hypothetical protein [Saprospiraceae bacterium]
MIIRTVYVYYSLCSQKREEVVHFSGFARKMNHILLFCERSEQ